jgi:hypothetical protein
MIEPPDPSSPSDKPIAMAPSQASHMECHHLRGTAGQHTGTAGGPPFGLVALLDPARGARRYCRAMNERPNTSATIRWWWHHSPEWAAGA